MKRALVACGVVSSALLLTAAAVSRARGDFARDLSRVPVDPAVAEAALQAFGTPIAAAAEIAARACTGAVAEIRLVEAGDAPYYAVRAFGQGREHHIRVDAASGQVTASEALPPYQLPGDPVTGELVTTSSGLMYYDLRVGDGRQPVRPTSIVQVHYTGWFVDGRKFDSSVDRRRPYETPLNKVITGWTEGIATMKVGSKRKLLVPHRLAYGEFGKAPTIPGKAMLIFDVELMAVIKD